MDSVKSLPENFARDLGLSIWIPKAIDFGVKVLVAIILFVIGRFIIRWAMKLLTAFMTRRRVDPAVSSFLKSAAQIILYILLAMAVLSQLGIEVVSFAALLASMGVAIGMALSNDLKNLAGGIVLLLTRPVRVGDYIEAQGQSGTIEEIQIFHTVLKTPSNQRVFIPNGLMSSGAIVNYSMLPTRRIKLVFGVEYDSDFDTVRDAILQVTKSDPRILDDPEPSIRLDELNDSSVDIVLFAWCKNEDYWDTMWDLKKTIYKVFNEKGISFPFPTVTLKQ